MPSRARSASVPAMGTAHTVTMLTLVLGNPWVKKGRSAGITVAVAIAVAVMTVESLTMATADRIVPVLGGQVVADSGIAHVRGEP